LGSGNSSRSIRPRVLVIAGDQARGAELARALGERGATPAMTTEVEAAKAARAVEPNLVVWITSAVAPAKLESVLALAARAAVALVTDDPSAPAQIAQRPGHELSTSGAQEPPAALAARLASLALNAALEGVALDDLGSGPGPRRPPLPTTPAIDVDLDLDRPTRSNPAAVRPIPRTTRPPPPSSRGAPAGGTGRGSGPRPASSAPPPAGRSAPTSVDSARARERGAGSVRPVSARPPPPSSRAPPPPSSRPPSSSPLPRFALASGSEPPYPAATSSAAPATALAAAEPPFPPPPRLPAEVQAWAPAAPEVGHRSVETETPAGEPPRTGQPDGPLPWARIPLSSAPVIQLAPRRRRWGVPLLLSGLLLAGGAVVAASRLGWFSSSAASALLASLGGGTAVEPSPSASAPAPSALSSSSASATSPAPSASASTLAMAVGPDAKYAETPHEAPTLAAVLERQGAVPSLAEASVPQLVALAADSDRRGAVEESLQRVALALQKEPRSLEARTTHLLILLHAGDAPQGIVQSEAYLADTPSPLLAELRGDALAARGRFDEARAAWLPEASPRGVRAAIKSIALNSARARLRKAQHAEAKRLFRRAAVLDMDDFEAVVALTEMLLSEGDARPAEAWAAHGCDLAPEVGLPHAQLGRARVALGDVPGALAAFEQAVKFNPSDRASVKEVVRLRDAGTE
jgi:hypothetical protein